MAKIIKEDKEVEVKDGESIKDACEELGVPIACSEGTCGACMIDIVEGEDNLTDLTDEENYFAMDKKHRLACQCKIKQGNVKIKA